MDPELTPSIVRPLAEGIDPVTGEELPEHSACQHPRVVRALVDAVVALEKESERNRRRQSQPRKTGSAWSEEEERLLVEGHQCGVPIKELASVHERSATGIEARLIQLGKISANTTFRGRRLV